MVEWKFIEKGPGCPFDYYEAAYKKYHNISIAKIADGEYTVMWKHLGTADIIKTIYTKDWDEAKASAISIVRDHINRQATYWRDMKIGLVNWIEED